MINFHGRNNSFVQKSKRLLTKLRGNYPDRLPDFLVVGATRSGTTTLYNVFKQHPDVFVPETKELHYFNNNALYHNDLRSYREMFGGFNDEKIIGEITPEYWQKGLVYPSNGRTAVDESDDAIVRISKAMPGVKLIVSLRDPFTRLRSNYTKNFNQKKIDHSLEKEIEMERSGNSRLQLIRRSRYHVNLQHMLAHFPESQIKVIIFEEWTAKESPVMDEILEFIGCDQKVPLPVKVSNRAEKYQKSMDSREGNLELSAQTMEYVSDEFREAREYIEKFLGRPVPWRDDYLS